jgi:hypothetical protein
LEFTALTISRVWLWFIVGRCSLHIRTRHLHRGILHLDSYDKVDIQWLALTCSHQKASGVAKCFWTTFDYFLSVCAIAVKITTFTLYYETQHADWISCGNTVWRISNWIGKLNPKSTETQYGIRVYRYVVEETIMDLERDPASSSEYTLYTSAPLPPSLPLVCRQIYHEARAFPESHTTLIIPKGVSFRNSFAALKRYPAHTKAVKKMCFAGGVSSYLQFESGHGRRMMFPALDTVELPSRFYQTVGYTRVCRIASASRILWYFVPRTRLGVELGPRPCVRGLEDNRRMGRSTTGRDPGGYVGWDLACMVLNASGIASQ